MIIEAIFCGAQLQKIDDPEHKSLFERIGADEQTVSEH